jgi:hypothetical protein
MPLDPSLLDRRHMTRGRPTAGRHMTRGAGLLPAPLVSTHPVRTSSYWVEVFRPQVWAFQNGPSLVELS